MLKQNLTREESLALATDLGLTKYIAVDKLIEGLQISQNKEINVCVVTTEKEVAESVLQIDLGINTGLCANSVLNLKACYGETCYTVVTEFGELSVDKNQLKNTLASSNKNVYCAVRIPMEQLRNLNLTLIYTPEYNFIDTDTWRCMMLKSDKTIIVLSADHILYAGEQEFIQSQVIPLYSPSRLFFGIGNAQYIKTTEWNDAVARIRMKIDGNYGVFPIFTEKISNERRSHYLGSDITLDSILANTQQDLINLRKTHFEDLDAYRLSVLEKTLIELRTKLERMTVAGIEETTSVEMDKNMLAESRKHLESNIDLFLNSPLVAKYRTAVEQFAESLKVSLQEDIHASGNIKQDARALPRYLTAVWDLFSEDQNVELYNEFQREVTVLIDMMNLDLRHITRNIRNIEIRGDIKKQLDSAFSVHTFFARKTNSGNSFTDALTIGGLLATIITPYGLVAVLASELVKIAGKEAIDSEYKKVLSEKISNVIEQNKEELLHQADKNFATVADCFRKEIMNYYDDVIASINETLYAQKERLANAKQTIETINKII